jgi:hypothetical protein
MERMRGINNIWLVRGGRTRSAVQKMVYNGLEGVKLVHNLICHLLDGFLGLIHGRLHVLVVSGGHLERGSAGKGKWVGGTTEKDL